MMQFIVVDMFPTISNWEPFSDIEVKMFQSQIISRLSIILNHLRPATHYSRSIRWLCHLALKWSNGWVENEGGDRPIDPSRSPLNSPN